MDEVRKTGGGGGVKGSVRRLHRTALHSSPLPLSRDPWGGQPLAATKHGTLWRPGRPSSTHPDIQASPEKGRGHQRRPEIANWWARRSS